MPKSSLNNLYRIMARKISGQATDREEKTINEWINSSLGAGDTYKDLKNIWSKRYFTHEDIELVSQKEAGDKIWNSVFNKKGRGKKNGIGHSFLVKLAAVFIFIITSAFIVFYVIDANPEVLPKVTKINKQTLPGHKSIITLRDGTVVSLNSGSTISYSSDFNDSLRIIYLEGQAFFEVFADRTKPFIVKCRNLEVETLGTSFDVDGYKDSPIQVSLLSGSVRLSIYDMDTNNGLILSPGEYSLVDKNDNYIDKGNFNPTEVLAWKEGRLIFKDATIEEIIPKLELWYGVKINNYYSINLEKPFTGIFEKENLDNILHNMARVMDFNYELEGNNVQIN